MKIDQIWPILSRDEGLDGGAFEMEGGGGMIPGGSYQNRGQPNNSPDEPLPNTNHG